MDFLMILSSARICRKRFHRRAGMPQTAAGQRGLQEHTANILKVAVASSAADFGTARGEAEKSLADVRKAADALAALKGDSAAGLDKLEEVTSQMAAITQERLKAKDELAAADDVLDGKLENIGARLGNLDAAMRTLRKSSTQQLSVSSEKAKDITQKLIAFGQVRDFAKDMGYALTELQRAETRKRMLVARSKLDTAFSEYYKNRLVASGNAMDHGKVSVEEGVQLAGEARHSLEEIVESSTRGAEMVERIAIVAEQQAATAMQVNASVEQIALVTRKTERSMEDVTRSAEELARIAEELARTAAWFKMAA